MTQRKSTVPSLIVLVLVLALSNFQANAWSQSSAQSRRAWFGQQGAVAASLLTGSAILSGGGSPASAAAPPTAAELEKLRKGQARVQYLLDHWDEETQICGKVVMSDMERKQVVRTEGGGSAGCEKTPLKVQDYLGFKSTEDPLFKAEKLMVRAAPLVDPDDFGDYLEVVEKYKDKADNTALMAYTASWGEANPNGGKEVIDDYLERTKSDVIDSERYLRQICGFLKLDLLPPSKKP